MIKLVTVISAALLLSACGESKEVSFETQEDSRRQASENAEYNANAWRNKNRPNAKLFMRGDSTISSKCAQGDGWVTVDIEEGGEFTELKCSSVSGTIGCMTTLDFKRRDQYASQDGSCNVNIPFPLPKIVK